MQEINKKELKKNIILLLITLVIIALFLEIFLRIFYPQKLYNKCYETFYSGGPGSLDQKDSLLGWRLKSNYISCSYQPDTNKIIYKTHNNQGIRLNYNISYNKGDKKRIVLLGDSMIYGHGLNDSDTFSTKFQRLVGDEYEVIPFAVPGYGTNQEFLWLKEEIINYNPDIVILFFYQNDFSDSSTPNPGYLDRPRYILQLKNNTDLSKTQNLSMLELTLENFPPTEYNYTPKFNVTMLSDTHPTSTFFMRFSHFYSLIYSNIEELSLENIIDSILDIPQNKSYKLNYYSFPERDSTGWSVETEYTKEMTYSMALILKFFEEFDKVSKQKNFKFVIVNIPSRLNVDPGYQDDFVNQFDDVDKKFFQFNKIEIIFLREIPSRGINYLSLYKIAQEDPSSFYFKTDIHLSPKGAELSSDYVYNELKKERIL